MAVTMPVGDATSSEMPWWRITRPGSHPGWSASSASQRSFHP